MWGKLLPAFMTGQIKVRCSGVTSLIQPFDSQVSFSVLFRIPLQLETATKLMFGPTVKTICITALSVIQYVVPTSGQERLGVNHSHLL